MEKQFRSYYDKANRQKGVVGENLLRLLERRLDNVVFQLGFATSRPEARQLVRHGHYTVNGRRVDIPSFLVRVGDVVGVKEASKSSPRLKEILSNLDRTPPKWMSLDATAATGTIIELPARDDIQMPIQEHLIVEKYSR